MTANNRLSDMQHWSDRWADHEPQTVAWDPTRPEFREVHALLQRTLPRDRSIRCLEVGAYPGSFLWYFQRFFDYRVSGLEYVDWCCDRARHLLAAAGVEAEMIHGDLFEYAPPAGAPLWDVVASFGFVEHFSDTALVVAEHLRLLRPGGYLVLVIPNHHGIYGPVLKRVEPDKYVLHNLMSYDDLREGVVRTGGADVVEGGYFGRIGFWNSGLYATMMRRGRATYNVVRAPFWAIERLGQVLPNSALLSPNAALVARKR